ncbi:MAG TPA: DUF1559 domain-containing protein [Pirellulales bacterium]|nr:DUF1559 domain-containing protein [Pirellulales bacterium]
MSVALKELLIVIGVIAFLLTLLAPAIQASRESARRSQCNNNLKQIGLALMNYADVHNSFPYDALWGRYPGGGDETADTRQAAYHYPWSLSIFPFLEASMLYSSIDKDQAIWNQSPQLGPRAAKAPRRNIRSLRIPTYLCPSDATFGGPDDLPGECMWTNYAGNVGVGIYSARVGTGPDRTGRTTAPLGTRGLFAFNDPARFGMITDGTSNTIAVAEVTSCSVAMPIVSGGYIYNDTLAKDLSFPADSEQPFAPTWDLRGVEDKIAPGSGKRRAGLRIGPNHSTKVPLVFRAALVALTESITGSGPCSLPDTYGSAQGGECGKGSGAGATAGFELAGTVGGTPIAGMAPLYNALYGPNSNWLGPDSKHPGVVVVVFADAHTSTIQNSISCRIWAMINTRAGDEKFCSCCLED